MTMTGFKLPAAHRSGATANGNVLRRKCNCGGKSSGGGDCDECKKKKETQLGIQKKLKIGASNDPLELEADRMADLVLRKPEPQPAAGKRSSGSSTHRQIQRQSTTAVGPASLSGDASSVISKVGTASPLPAGVRSDFENRFGQDFSHVRIHTGDHASKSAESFQAKAYTLGSHIVFGNGQFAPNTVNGRQLLAHELTHISQQAKSEPVVQRLSEEVVPAGVAISSEALAISRALFAKFAAEAGSGLLAVSETAAASAAVVEAEVAVAVAMKAGGTAAGLSAAGGTGLIAAGGIEAGTAGTGTPIAAVVALGALVLVGAGAAVGYAYRDEIKAAWEKASLLVATAIELIRKALSTKADPQAQPESQTNDDTSAESQTKSRKCSDAEVTKQNKEMHKACDQPRGCNMGDDCKSATAKWAAGNSCVRQRTELQQRCFQAGDPRYHEHMEKIAQESAALRRCIEIMSLKCHGKNPVL